MTKKYLTEVVLVVDRSGSMAGVAADMEGGMRELVKSQIEDIGETRITYTRFDTEIEHVLENVESSKVNLKDLTLEPRGGTALLDAIGLTINKVGQRLANTPEDERPGLIVFVVVTDGGENSSREFTNQQIKDMIKLQESQYKWQFTFLGANQDSFTVAGCLGFQAGKISNYTMNNSYDVLSNGASSMVRCLKQATIDGLDYSSVEYSEEIKNSLSK